MCYGCGLFKTIPTLSMNIKIHIIVYEDKITFKRVINIYS